MSIFPTGRDGAPPIQVLDLFEPLNDNLVALLAGLPRHEWERPTICSRWSVKDIAAHLLDGMMRRLSIHRDGFAGDPPGAIGSYNDLLAYLDRLNADWVAAMRRISPEMLVELLRMHGPQVAAFFRTLDPFAPAIFSVAWAGQTSSPTWFDVARDYTEQWLHQQQIRLAVGAPGAMERDLFYPVLATFLLALPHTYRDVDAAEGTAVRVVIDGEAGGRWRIAREDGLWRWSDDSEDMMTAATVAIPQDLAWRLFSKGIRPDAPEARQRVAIDGDAELGAVALSMISVMA